MVHKLCPRSRESLEGCSLEKRGLCRTREWMQTLNQNRAMGETSDILQVHMCKIHSIKTASTSYCALKLMTINNFIFCYSGYWFLSLLFKMSHVNYSHTLAML